MIKKLDKNNFNLNYRINYLTYYLRNVITKKDLELIPTRGEGYYRLGISMGHKDYAHIIVTNDRTLLTVCPGYSNILPWLQNILSRILKEQANFSYSIKKQKGLNNHTPVLEWIHKGSLLKEWSNLENAPSSLNLMDIKFLTSSNQEFYKSLLDLLNASNNASEEELFCMIEILEGYLLNNDYYFSNGKTENIKSNLWVEIMYCREECIKQLKRFNIKFPELKPGMFLDETDEFKEWHKKMTATFDCNLPIDQSKAIGG